MIVMGVPIPMTDRERLLVRLVIATREAMRPININRIRLTDGVFCGSWRHHHSNTAGSSCYRTHYHPHYHRHYTTNHPQPIDGVIE